MNIIRTSFLLLAGGIHFISQAATFEAKVSEVVLYKTKARETRQLSIPASETGRQEWVLTNIPQSIDPSSLQVSVTGATLISAGTQMNYLAANPKGKQIKAWQDSLEKVEDQLVWVKEQLQVYQGEIKLLQEIIKVDGDETSAYAKSAAEMLDLYRTRSLKAREATLELMKKEKELQKQANNLRQQIANAGGATQAVQEIKLLVDVARQGNVQVKCQYMVNGTGWTPMYNLRSGGLNQPIQVEMLASIIQNTGYDWDNVQLSLSTADPSSNQSRPVMNPLYIDFYRPVQMLENVAVTQGKANMALSARPRAYEGDAQKEEEVFQSLEPVESPVAQIYTFSTPQQIRSGKEAQQIMVSSLSASAEFIYHAIPKKDLTAYLIAKVPDWEKYNLLPGKASIFFEDTYVGTTTINPKVANDTLLLSMGRDEMIQIERIAVKDVSSNKWLGVSRKEVKAFEIKVRNNKKTEVQVEVLDQIPVSRQKDIEVVLESSDGAEYSAEDGRLKWVLNLKPGETRKLRFSFSYKYPGNQSVIMRN